MVKSAAKKGRPQAYYRTSWDDKINGLTRLKDGRWKVSGINGEKPVKFTEANEYAAVERALAMLSGRKTPTIKIPRAIATMNDPASLKAAVKMFPEPARNLSKLRGTYLPPDHPEARTKLHEEADGDPIQIQVHGNRLWFLKDDTQEIAFFHWLREMILLQPKWLAQKTGIEQLGWLTDLKRPTAAPKMADVLKNYRDKPTLSAGESRKSKLFWNEFMRATGATTVGDITHEVVTAYEKRVVSQNLAPKSMLHRYRMIRTILHFAIKRGMGIEDCRKALDVTAMLEVKNAHPIDPTPITTNEFWAIYREAEKAGDTMFMALMLTALNTCSYGGEVATIKWSEVDLESGTYVGRRPKTKLPRVACLWPETIAALKQVPVRTAVDYVFNTSRRSYTANGVLKVWAKYRTAAKLPDEVTFGRIRDAAYSLACQHASLDQAKILAGHKFGGMSDFYIRRNPTFVADACAAIRKEFFEQAKAKKRK